MDIGKPERVIIVEPLQAPVVEPEPETEPVEPAQEPSKRDR